MQYMQEANRATKGIAKTDFAAVNAAIKNTKTTRYDYAEAVREVFEDGSAVLYDGGGEWEIEPAYNVCDCEYNKSLDAIQRLELLSKTRCCANGELAMSANPACTKCGSANAAHIVLTERGFGVKWINLTPHEIVVYGSDDQVLISIPPYGKVLRVEEESHPQGEIDGVPIVSRRYGGFALSEEELPRERSDTCYIVSALAAMIGDQIGRSDFYAPDTGPGGAVRDEDGRLIGTRRLIKVMGRDAAFEDGVAYGRST